MSELFEKVHIETEDDLPKILGWYFIKPKDDYGFEALYNPEALITKNAWLRDIEYYLRPVEQKPITDADIEAWAKEGISGDKTHKNTWLQGRIEGAKAMRDNEIKHIEK